MPKHTKPPVYLAADLWMALDLPIGEFDAYYDRNGWADTWANLLGSVRSLAGRPVCPVIVDGEPCELLDGHIAPHMGFTDLGSSEPLPPTVHQPGEQHGCSYCGRDGALSVGVDDDGDHICAECAKPTESEPS
jgi:hypothetical protein